MKKYQLLLLILVSILITASVIAQEGRRPLSVIDIEELLRAGVTSRRLAALVEERGVNFEVTEEVREKFKRAGADVGVLQAVGKAAVRYGGRKKFEPPPLGQDNRVVEEAKREGGNVVVYGSLESDIMEAVGRAFQKKTGINMQYWRASAVKVIDRVISEYRAGRPLFDVILTLGTPLKILFREGILAKYESPSTKDFPGEAVDPTFGPRYSNVIIGIATNRRVIRTQDTPNSLEDLLRPQFRGKLVMPNPTQNTTTIQWLASLFKLMGKDRADKFVRDLAAMRPILVESLLPSAERVTTGELPIAITYVKYVYLFGTKGAPLDYVRLGRFLGEGHYVGLNNKAPHPNAGKAFIDFFLSEESMTTMAKMGEFVTRKGIYPPLPDADKIQFVEMVDLDARGFAEKKIEYQRVFFGR